MEEGPRAHIRRVFPVASAAVLLTMLVAPVTARADTSMAGKSAARLVDLSSDPQAADFYVDGNRAWSGVAYKTVSNYIEVGPGNHVFEVRKAGSPADSPSLARVQGMMKPDSYYTVMIAGRFDSLKASVFDDGSSAMPTSDICQARFINATPDLTIDVTVRGLNASFPNLGFLQASSYGQLPKGVYDVEIKDRANQKVIATVQNFVAPGGHMHSLVAAGGKGSPVELVEFYDAMTAEALPEGAAHTGMGGLQRGVSLASAWALLPAALLASMLALAGLRRPRPDPPIRAGALEPRHPISRPGVSAPRSRSAAAPTPVLGADPRSGAPGHQLARREPVDPG